MNVDASTFAWEWERKSNTPPDHAQGGEDTKDSVASTVCDTFEEEEPLQRFHSLLKEWLECSIIMPSSRCCGLKLPAGLSVPHLASKEEGSPPSAFALEGQLLAAKHLDAAVSGTAAAASAAHGRMAMTLLLPARGARAAAPSGSAEELCRRLLFSSSGLEWFREALGGMEETKAMFANAYFNIQSISKPQEVKGAASSTGCMPWALVQVAESNASICCHSLMQVPFRQFKRHSRNGVVFCLYGGRVFCTCMDAECMDLLKRRSRTYFSLARELEEIHLGAYDDHITLSQDEFFASILQHSPFAQFLAGTESHRELLQREARKRWIRAMEQGGTQLSWMEKQVARIQRGKPVSCSEEANEASMADLEAARKVASKLMCSSATGDRTWVELKEATVREYAAWVRGASAVPGKKRQQQQQQQLLEDGPMHKRYIHQEKKGGKAARAGTVFMQGV